jgi:hypothetical protein
VDRVVARPFLIKHEEGVLHELAALGGHPGLAVKIGERLRERVSRIEVRAVRLAVLSAAAPVEHEPRPLLLEREPIEGADLVGHHLDHRSRVFAAQGSGGESSRHLGRRAVALGGSARPAGESSTPRRGLAAVRGVP